jgi:hypothetical protein
MDCERLLLVSFALKETSTPGIECQDYLEQLLGDEPGHQAFIRDFVDVCFARNLTALCCCLASFHCFSRLSRARLQANGNKPVRAMKTIPRGRGCLAAGQVPRGPRAGPRQACSGGWRLGRVGSCQ